MIAEFDFSERKLVKTLYSMLYDPKGQNRYRLDGVPKAEFLDHFKRPALKRALSRTPLESKEIEEFRKLEFYLDSCIQQNFIAETRGRLKLTAAGYKLITWYYWFNASRDVPIFIAVLALLVSGLNTYYAGKQAYDLRQSSELSLRPHVDISFYYGSQSTSPQQLPDGAGYAVLSDGLGPAIIKWTRVWVNSKLVGTWDEVNSEMGYPEPVPSGYTRSNPTAGVSLKVGDLFSTYTVPPGRDAAWLIQNAGRLEMTICYCSVYSEIDSTQCWQASNIKQYIKTGCDAPPSIIFGS